ncbi:MAG: hypothetical protein KKB81_00545 [Candidatus Margulisbacteria bacterium]|nr:hypothetical protein [Candidatus Margulisiibacteriota bacterium]MBU1022312.1 hypothetical protein [Candidatus Margulisiibacteriota bacterium]MBU1729925.1 hypothetical protein [Candidatus Margulisiibacteriota bacterium]MBU1955958.1 hypothetical protein [Candidatus Margulisiibacteriota bacterium]
MIKKISLFIIICLLLEIPALGASPLVLNCLETIWSGEVELASDVIVPAGSTLIIMPGTNIKCVYDYEDDNFTPNEWKIIVKGNLIANGEENEAIIIDPTPYGLSAIKVPLNSNINTIKIAPKEINTEKIRDEFSVFRWQYLALWGLLFGSIYYAIQSR